MHDAEKLQPVQRVVTGHDGAGRAVIRSEGWHRTSSRGESRISCRCGPATAVDNNDETEGRERAAGLTLHGGSVIRVVDMLPGGQSPMHRSNSIDYGIVLTNEIELELDSGEKRTVKAGGVIVQRGTNHLWRNRTSQTTRIVFVLIEAAAYRHNGEPLPEVMG
ncbi:MAG: cupin domain-containing protein [Proteobacteria bacterium]|nr:cupin domain-containing protein [Pseudomonadota bacterium]